MRPLLLLLATIATASAQRSLIREVADTVTDTHVEVTALFTKLPPSGYFPVRVKIANNLKRNQSVRLDFTSTLNYSDELKSSSAFDFSAAAGKTITRDILVPICPTGGPDADNVRLTAQLTGSMGNAAESIDSTTGENQPAALLSEALFTPNASALDAAAASSFHSRYGRSGEDFAGKFSPGELPDDWRAFSGYDSVIMTDLDWTACPPGSRNAILAWVHLGGQLVIYSESEVNRAGLGLPEDAGAGSIAFPPMAGAAAIDPALAVSTVKRNRIPPIRTGIRSDYQSGWPLQGRFGQQQFRYGLFIAVLVLFGILVGPVNLFVFAKSGRRHRLFITTPIISLGASLLLIGLIVVQDGFGGYGMRRVLMQIQPSDAAAYIHQEQISRTGVLLKSGMKINTPVKIEPVPIMQSRWARFTSASAKGSYNLQPADGVTTATGDWFQSRSEQGQAITAVISTRGRIEKTPEAGALLSAFDFPIDTIYYRNDSGEWSVATGIAPGTKFRPTAIDEDSARKALLKQVRAFGDRNRKLMEGQLELPGHFVALASKAPAIETNAGIRWKSTQTVITGVVSNP